MKAVTGEMRYAKPLLLGLVGVVTFGATWVAADYLWKEWLLLAVAVSGLYFSGVFRFFPWKTAYAKAFSTGVFVGMLIPVIGFIRSLA
jgi:hypothetical protein